MRRSLPCAAIAGLSPPQVADGLRIHSCQVFVAAHTQSSIPHRHSSTCSQAGVLPKHGTLPVAAASGLRTGPFCSHRQSILNHSGKSGSRSQSGNCSSDVDGSLPSDRHDECASTPGRQRLFADILLRWILAWQLCASRRMRLDGSNSH